MISIISIEGNIGSGKSTIIQNLKAKFEKEDYIYFLDEPVSEWTTLTDNSGKNIIEKFYEDKERYSFSFQMMAYISRLSNLKNLIKNIQTNYLQHDMVLIICERSLETDRNVFCQMLYDQHFIEEINYQIYMKWFDEFMKELPPISYVYIQTDPEVAYERVQKRNRKGETMGLDYLKACHAYHEKWLSKCSLIIDGNVTKEKTTETVIDIVNDNIIDLLVH